MNSEYEEFDEDDDWEDLEERKEEDTEDYYNPNYKYDEDTDLEVINAGFKALNDANIYARQNFSCCMGCGFSEIVVPAKASNAIGITFYHNQDHDHLLESGSTYLAYDTMCDEFTQEEIGQKIFDILKNSGVHAKWNSSIDERIQISITLEDETK